MNMNEPGLFDLPDVHLPLRPRPSRRGRNREIWLRTAIAVVTVTDPAAVREAWAHAEEGAVVIAAQDATSQDAAEDKSGPSDDPIEILPWLIWPTQGLDGLLETGAVRVLEASSEVEPESAGRALLTWSLIMKISDVVELRRLALEAHPGDEVLINQSLEVAWNCAADPTEPLRPVPGIVWKPPRVKVRLLPSREFWGSGQIA